MKRLTQYAHGGGCACKIPPGELEAVVAGLSGAAAPRGPGELLVGLDDGDDAAVVRLSGGMAIVATADFFTPVVDDAYDWGRIAAANALSDVYAMGGTPIVAVNLLAGHGSCCRWSLPPRCCGAGWTWRGRPAATWPAGTVWTTRSPSTAWRSPGSADPERLLRNDAGAAGVPLTLTKPLGIGVLNTRHKATGEVFPQAVAR